MARAPKDSIQLRADFYEAIELLEIACSTFDGVTFKAAKTISNLLHQLVDDRGTNKSHATKLGFTKTLRIWKRAGTPTGPGYRNALASFMMGIGSGPTGLVPVACNFPSYLVQGHNKSPAIEDNMKGWLDEPIIGLSAGDQFSRRTLVRLVRDQDAGAHSDTSLDKIYVDFKHSTGFNPESEIMIMGKTTTIAQLAENPALASLRQIAHEFLSSIYSDAALRPQRNPRCIVHEYGDGGVLKAIRRPKSYPKQPINAPTDILIEH